MNTTQHAHRQEPAQPLHVPPDLDRTARFIMAICHHWNEHHADRAGFSFAIIRAENQIGANDPQPGVPANSSKGLQKG